jgi:cytochrome c
MKKLTAPLMMIAVATALLSQPARADSALADKSTCTGCHAADKKILGPAFQEVAKKYADQKDAVEQLAVSIKKGGVGKWGQIPMPAMPTLSDADAKTLAVWIMAGSK